jgi:hypothetical protein
VHEDVDKDGIIDIVHEDTDQDGKPNLIHEDVRTMPCRFSPALCSSS